MDYLARVQQAIDYIEQHLTENIKTLDVAKQAAFSLYHFHRIFHAMTGDTIKSYIRRRRLTEAALELIDTDKKIIEIAYDYQFETPESFSRAFKKVYGIPPIRYRQHNNRYHYLHVKPINHIVLKHLNGGITMEPKIVTKDRFQVIGMSCTTSTQNTMNTIPPLWDEFAPRIKEISSMIDQKVCYGLCYPIDETKSDDVEFEYVACVEVTSLDEIPEGMIGKVVDTQKYAVFTHKGELERLKDTYNYIFGTWAPKSDYDLEKAVDFEYYDERFHPESAESEVDIYIPIK